MKRGGVVRFVVGAVVLAAGLMPPAQPAPRALAADVVPAHAGVVTHVGDGDTLWVRLDGRTGPPMRVRLHGLDAPEACQRGGAQATAALRDRVLKRRVTVQPRSTDDYRRQVATVQLDGEDVGAWLVREGHAWDSGFARRPGPYTTEQREAQRQRRGLFADPSPVEPRTFRREHGPCR